MHYLNIELDGLDENSNKHRYKLSDFNGENLIVYFYPEDDTPVCTQEAHSFKEAMNDISKYAKVIGISPDNLDDHFDFKEKHKLNFILLSDIDNKLKDAFKEHAPNVSNLQRATFILDKEGNIIKLWEKVDVESQIQEILEFFKNI